LEAGSGEMKQNEERHAQLVTTELLEDKQLIAGVYVLHAVGHHKIGRSTDVRNRLRDIQVGCPTTVELVAAYEMSKSAAYQIEGSAHYALSKKRGVGGGEWFNCTESQALKAVQQAIQEKLPAGEQIKVYRKYGVTKQRTEITELQREAKTLSTENQSLRQKIKNLDAELSRARLEATHLQTECRQTEDEQVRNLISRITPVRPPKRIKAFLPCVPLPDVGERKVFLVDEIAVFTGVTRSTIYEHVRTGKLRALKIGHSIRIPIPAIREAMGLVEDVLL